jgi:predicted PurR-regulated permease PerM
MDIKIKWYYRLGFLLLLFVVIYIFLKLKPLWQPLVQMLFSAITPFIVAAFIAYLLHPIVNKLILAGFKRVFAVIFIYVLFFGGVGFALYKGIPIILHQLKDLSDNAPYLSNQYEKWMGMIEKETAGWPHVLRNQIKQVIMAIEHGFENLFRSIMKGIFWILDSFIVITLIPFIAFYMLKDVDRIKLSVWYLTPKRWRKQGTKFLKSLDETLGNYLRGQLTVCAAIGSISAILFWMIDLKYPLLLGLVIGITNIIPYFGPIIGAIPAVAVGFMTSEKMVLWVIVIIFVLQFLEGNILSPFIVGKSLHMHPLLIIFALLLGGEIGGILGLIVAVPILATIRTALIQLLTNVYKKESSTTN